MKITISHDKETKQIELTSVQEKSVKLMGGMKVLAEKMNGILIYLEEQARQRVAEKRLQDMTAEDVDTIINEM